MVDAVMAFPEGTRVQILGPVVRGRKGEYRQVLEEIRKEGFVRVRVDGEVREVTDDIPLDRYKQHTIEVVVDRLVVKPGIETRLADSIEPALRMGKGILGVLYEPPPSRDREGGEPLPRRAREGAEQEREQKGLLFSAHFACMDCGISLEDLAPGNC